MIAYLLVNYYSCKSDYKLNQLLIKNHVVSLSRFEFNYRINILDNLFAFRRLKIILICLLINIVSEEK